MVMGFSDAEKVRVLTDANKALLKQNAQMSRELKSLAKKLEKAKTKRSKEEVEARTFFVAMRRLEPKLKSYVYDYLRPVDDAKAAWASVLEDANRMRDGLQFLLDGI
jgi:predicted RNase H-like nuclease (RuvC/YqgF family)